MQSPLKYLTSLACFTCAMLQLSAATYYVTQANEPGMPDGCVSCATSGNICCTFTDALTAAGDGDTIQIQVPTVTYQGTYTAPCNINVVVTITSSLTNGSVIDFNGQTSTCPIASVFPYTRGNGPITFSNVVLQNSSLGGSFIYSRGDNFTFSGTSTVGGSSFINNAWQLDASNPSHPAGFTFNAGDYTQPFSGNIDIINNTRPPIINNTASTVTISGDIAASDLGTGWEVQVQCPGGGRVVFSGAITGPGQFIGLPNSILEMSGTSTSITFTSANILYLNPSNQTGATVSMVGAGGGNPQLLFTQDGTLAGTLNLVNTPIPVNDQGFSVVISAQLQMPGGGSYNKVGSGVQTLTNNANVNMTYRVSAGTLSISNPLQVGVNCPLILSGGTLFASTSLSDTNTQSITLSTTGGLAAATGQTLTEVRGITGSGILTIGTSQSTLSAAGTVVLNGVNTFSGSMVVGAVSGSTSFPATVSVPNLAALGSITSLTLQGTGVFSPTTSFSLLTLPIALGTNGGTLSVGGALTLTIPGTITGAVGNPLTITGGGLVVLNGTNSYAGGTSISAGSVTAGATSALGSGTATMANATTLNISNSVTLSNAFSLTGTGNFFVDSGNTGTISGNFASTAGILNKTGSGTLVLSGTNSYSGGTALTAGAITAGSNTALGSGTTTMANATTINLNNGVSLSNAFSLTGTGNFFVDSGNTATISGNFAVTAGILNKTGSGTLILSGTNSYSGGTTLTSGAITAGSNTALGSGTTTMANATTLNINNGITLSNAFSLTGTGNFFVGSGNTAAISGDFAATAGILNKTGSGTLVLSGVNSYSGGTTLTAGSITAGSNSALGSGTVTMADTTTLNLNNGVNLPGAFSLTGTGNFFVDSGNTATISGNFAATAGILNKTGTGTLALSGTNSYSGGTNLTAGNISVAAGSSLGSGALNFTGGNLIVTAATTIPNAMSVTSDATITSSADTVFSGVLTGSSGITLDLEGSGNSLSEVAVSSGTFTITGPIGGTQDLTKTGSGTLVLSGSSLYTGATNLNAGTLLVTGDISSTSLLTVASGATLTGDGTVGPTVVNGTIEGGNPLGTLTVDGTLSLESGSIFTTTIVPGDPSLVSATGAVTINNGSTWNLFITPGHYTFVNTFVVLEGASVTGQFSNLTVLGQPLNTGILELAYFPTEVVAFIIPAALNTLAIGENEVHTIEAVSAADIFLPEVFTSLLPLSFSTEDFNDALSRIHPAQLKGMAITQENNALQVRQAISERIVDEIDAQICFPSFGAHKENRTCCEKHKRIMTAWVSPMGSALTQDKVVNHFGPLTAYRANTTGVVGGLDAFFGDHFYAGAIGAYTDSHLDFNSNKGSGNVYSSYAGLYAAAITEMFYANLSVVGSLSTYQTKRHIEYGSGFTAVNLDARESHKGKQILSHFDTGINFNFGGYTLRPFDSFDYMSQSENGYNESDAGEWDLSVGEKNAVMIRNELGLEFVARLCTRHSKWTFSPKIAWVREVRTKGGGYDVQFIAGGADFKIHGYFPDRSLVAPGMSIAGMFLDDSLTLNLYYNGEFKGNYSANNYGGRVSYSF